MTWEQMFGPSEWLPLKSGMENHPFRLFTLLGQFSKSHEILPLHLSDPQIGLSSLTTSLQSKFILNKLNFPWKLLLLLENFPDPNIVVKSNNLQMIGYSQN